MILKTLLIIIDKFIYSLIIYTLISITDLIDKTCVSMIKWRDDYKILFALKLKP